MREVLVVFALILSGCIARPEPPKQETTIVVRENKIYGTVDAPWVEPMYDTIEVPPGIDPANTYYRPAHKSVVEIRPERFERVQFDDEKERRQAEGR